MEHTTWRKLRESLHAFLSAFVLFHLGFSADDASQHSREVEHEVTKIHKGLESHEEHEKISSVTMTIAVLLFGFLVVNTALLYLVNCHDSDIRSYAYKMISVTISIFCAVLLNQAVFSFWFDQILPSPPPRGFGIKVDFFVRSCIGSVLFLCSFCCISFLSLSFARYKAFAWGARSIGAHLCAFSGILTFGAVQQYRRFKDSLLLVILVTGVAEITMLVLRSMTVSIRLRCCSSKHGGGNYSLLPDTEEESDDNGQLLSITDDEAFMDESTKRGHQTPTLEEEELESEVNEAEDEAVVMIMSFLTIECLCFWINGQLPGIHGVAIQLDTKWTPASIRSMFFCSVFFLALLIVATFIRAGCCGTFWVSGQLKHRIICNIQGTAATLMSWCFLVTGNLIILKWMSHDNSLVDVVNAFVMSILAVLMIMGLDPIADMMRQRHPEDAQHAHPDDGEDDVFRSGSAEKFNLTLEVSLRRIIGAWGLLVGLSWDRAFDAASETIVHGCGLLNRHKVISKICICLVLVCFVLPAWMMYIVPKASMHRQEHECRIKEELQLKKIQGTFFDGTGCSCSARSDSQRASDRHSDSG